MSTVNFNRNEGSLIANARAAWNAGNQSIHWNYDVYGGAGNVQYHHIHPVSSFNGIQTEVTNIYSLAGENFDINSAENALVLPNSQDAQRTGANNTTYGSRYGALHSGNSDFHAQYNAFHRSQVERALARYEAVAGAPGATQAQKVAAAKTFTVEMNNLRDFMRDGLSSNSLEKLIFFANNNDVHFSEIARAAGTNRNISDYYKDHLEGVKSAIPNHADRISISQAEDGRISLYRDGTQIGTIYPDWQASLLRSFVRGAGGAAAIVGPLLVLSLVGNAEAHAAEVRGVSRDKVDVGSDEITAYLRQTNLNLGDVASLFTDIAKGAAVDIALSIAASMTGFGLLWKGYEIYQNYGDIRGALDMAVAANPDMPALKSVRDAILSVEEYLIDTFGLEVTGAPQADGTYTITKEPPELTTLQRHDMMNRFYDSLDPSLKAEIDALVRERNYPGSVFRLLNEDAKEALLKEFLEGKEKTVEDILRRADPYCFAPGTPVSRPGGVAVNIESIRPGDLVTAYDRDGNLRPARVTAVHVNQVAHILDVHGLMVTPGHHTLCGDGPYADQHVPIIDILRTDGALVREDGSKVRAATGCDLRSTDDQFVWAITGDARPDGTTKLRAKGRIRLGTRVITPEGLDISVRELIAGAGGTVTSSGLIVRGEGGPQMPFLWTFGDHLPKPEDYVLQRSGLSLMDLYDGAGMAVSDLSMRQ